MAARFIPGLSIRTFQAWECNRQTPPLWAQALVLDALGGPPYEAAERKKQAVVSVKKAAQTVRFGKRR